MREQNRQNSIDEHMSVESDLLYDVQNDRPIPPDVLKDRVLRILEIPNDDLKAITMTNMFLRLTRHKYYPFVPLSNPLRVKEDEFLFNKKNCVRDKRVSIAAQNNEGLVYNETIDGKIIKGTIHIETGFVRQEEKLTRYLFVNAHPKVTDQPHDLKLILRDDRYELSIFTKNGFYDAFLHELADKAQYTGDIVPLSEREQEVLRLKVKDFKYKEIAKLLVISPETVRRHIDNLHKKTHGNIYDAVRIYYPDLLDER